MASSPMRIRRRLPAWQRVTRTTLCFMGLGLSLYAYYVEMKKEEDKDYEATCDFNESVSCSKVFTSRYGRGFGVVEHILGKDSMLNMPNSLFGIVFFFLQYVLGQFISHPGSFLLLSTSIFANMGSVYLAYILYYVLHDCCLVCVSTYVVNFLLLVVNIRHNIFVKEMLKKKKV
ncbi:vitamin K epoxide reductase complex subunit 1-like protein 1 [Saccoglossus kowalevskii]|uniref:vitamin-K-epoxide reductase (warfarin-sensitive) n=1 Tax=Saccoglossus kowalevskii TaxID=10224 RepID=A0ABM0GSZ4_SACKO|nr:PREDICTED: vitamin K epoxide reductase complex subunit 1-like protein 1-like [Saccoglossus kowalevskii]